MALFDVRIGVDASGRIQTMDWNDGYLWETYEAIWMGFRRRELTEVFGDSFREEAGALLWQDEKLTYAVLPAEWGGVHVLLRRDDDTMFLYESALDKIIDGIQIYDKNACVVYINKASRGISEIPDLVDARGRHLLDLYNLDENISTVMTSLKTGAPVINRFDVFKSTTGTDISTTNTAYPIFRNRNLAGSIVFEQNMSVVNAQIAQLQGIQKAMGEKKGGLPTGRFSGYTFDDVIGSDQKLILAVSLARRIATQDCNVLLVGETGTGKEIFAQSIHNASNRNGKFLAINCAAVPDQLIEGLFFGTSKGSFTGSADKPGYAEEANGGTLFLDELNSMSLSMQAKILRVIQEGVFRRVGGDKEIKTDIRIISSCNEDPFHLIGSNILRKDLFYRLSTVLIDLPPLREHTGDIEELVEFYVSKKSCHYAKSIEGITPSVMELFRRYSWPGNVRELFHVLDHMLNVVDDGMAEVCHLPKYMQAGLEPPVPQPPTEARDYSREELQHIMDEFEASVLRQVLEHYGCNISRAAESLGIRRQSLQYRIRKYGIVI